MASALSVAAANGACKLPADALSGCPAPSCFTCPRYSASAAVRDVLAERGRIHDALDAAGRRGLTQRELVTRARLSPAVVHERLAELVKEGAVARRRYKRRTPSGGHATVYILPWGGP